jgi:hypothetical protein
MLNGVRMSTHKHEIMVAVAALILVVYALSLSMYGQVLSAVQTNKTLSNTGAIQAVGVGVYSDQACTSPVSSISWGTISPGSNVNKTVYIRNEGNAAATLSMTTSNWSPANASNYMTLKWNYGGQSLAVNQVVQVMFTLSVSSSITGITSFSFTITITATG